MDKNLIYVYVNGKPYVEMYKLCMITILSQYEENMFDLLIITEEDYIEDIKEVNNYLNNFFEGVKYYFMITGQCVYVNSHSIGTYTGKLEIINWEKLQDYSKIIYTDVDILFGEGSVKRIFDCITEEDKLYISSESLNYKTPWFYHEGIYSKEECNLIERRGFVNGLNTGLWGWYNNRDSSIIKQILSIRKNAEEKGSSIITSAAEQPYINHRFLVDGNFDVSFNPFAIAPPERLTRAQNWKGDVKGLIFHYTGPSDKVARMNNDLHMFLSRK